MEKEQDFFAVCISAKRACRKIIGIVGFGSIGSAVAKIAQAFEMKVLAYNRSEKQADGVEFVSFDELLERSDIVTVHCPLNSDSDKMFGKEQFAK